MKTSNKALFFDRDGTLIVHQPYLCNPTGVELLHGVRETLVNAMADDYLLFLFTNQSDVGRGLFTMREVDACNQRMFELLNLPDPGFTGICVAPELPGATSSYRKPSPKFILEMISKYDLSEDLSWMVGDTLSDVQAGVSAGIKAALVNYSRLVALPGAARQFANVASFYDGLKSSYNLARQ